MQTGESADVAFTALLFDRVLASKQPLVVVDTRDAAQVIDHVRQYARRSVQSIYMWRDDAGITSMREGEVRVPGSKRMTDALRYILQSMHFGIYVFPAVEGHLRPPNTGILRQIGRIRGGNARKVVFIGGPVCFPESLNEMIERIGYDGVRPTRPRLRDGRWVI